jgi:hypothetical protein
MLERFTKDERAAMDLMIEQIGPGISSTRSAEKMVEVLVDLGWELDMAQRFVDAVHGTMQGYVASPPGRAAVNKFYRRCMLLGVVWALAGAIAGLAAWASAMGLPAGGPSEKSIAAGRVMTLAAWAATAVGTFSFLRGLTGILRGR